MNSIVDRYLSVLCRRTRVDITTIRGLSTDQLAELSYWEKSKSIRLPLIYKDYITAVGPSYDLLMGPQNFEGKISSTKDFCILRNIVNEVLEECESSFRLHDDAFVISICQRESFMFFILEDRDDPPVYRYDCGDAEYRLECPSFSDYLESLIAETWGYY